MFLNLDTRIFCKSCEAILKKFDEKTTLECTIMERISYIWEHQLLKHDNNFLLTDCIDLIVELLSKYMSKVNNSKTRRKEFKY